VYGFVMLASSFGLAYGIAYLTGTEESPLWYVGTGVLAAVLDLAYRLKMRRATGFSLRGVGARPRGPGTPARPAAVQPAPRHGPGRRGAGGLPVARRRELLGLAPCGPAAATEPVPGVRPAGAVPRPAARRQPVSNDQRDSGEAFLPADLHRRPHMDNNANAIMRRLCWRFKGSDAMA
jgi:hypothetical protein